MTITRRSFTGGLAALAVLGPAWRQVLPPT